MKINKNTAWVCAISIMISGIIVIFLGCFAPQTAGYNTIQNIVLGIFSSSIVSFIISFVGYFHERSSIIEKTENNIKSLYINMCVLSKITGDTLQQIHMASDLSILPFGNISGLSKLNVDVLNNMDLGLFQPICKKGQLSKVYSDLIEFQQITYNIKNISMNLHAQTLEYSNQYLKMHNEEMLGIQANSLNIQNLDALKNLINIRTEKLHEYIIGKSLEFEKIIKIFYKQTEKKQSWENIKTNLLMQIEEIVKG